MEERIHVEGIVPPFRKTFRGSSSVGKDRVTGLDQFSGWVLTVSPSPLGT